MEKSLDKVYKLLIGGEWVEAEGGKTFEAVCPATGEVLTSCALASKQDVDKAVKAHPQR